MTRRKRDRRKRRTGQLIAAGLVVAAAAVGGLVLSQRSAPENGTALRDSDTAFSVPDNVGQPAPEFAAIGVDGQPYTVTPGDGRPKAIVFYMGFQ